MRGATEKEVAIGRRVRQSYLAALAIVAIATGINWLVNSWLTVTDLAMVYLLGVVIAAVYCDRNVSIVCAVLSFAAFDFFFVPPLFTLRFAQSQ
jgi:two-component system sensor histidine kinase KdpD